jgi:hypothetical protein
MSTSMYTTWARGGHLSRSPTRLELSVVFVQCPFTPTTPWAAILLPACQGTIWEGPIALHFERASGSAGVSCCGCCIGFASCSRVA